MIITHDPRIADYEDYLCFNNKDRDKDTFLIEKIRGESKGEVLPNNEDPEWNESYEEACLDARDQLAEQRSERDYQESWYKSI